MQPGTIIYYHGWPYEPPNSRQQYITAALSKFAKVIYLDKKSGRSGITVRKVSDNLVAVSGLVHIAGWLERHGCFPLAKLICSIFVLFMVRRPLLFWLAENTVRPDRFFKVDFLVYDCMDPCFTTDSSFERREREIVQAANLVFATAAELAKDCSRYKPANLVHLLPNACAPDDYTHALLEGAPKPDWWTEIEPPIAVYLGSLDWRFAFEHMLYAAKQQPKVSFIVAGNVPLEFRKKAEELGQLPNVIVPGMISLEDARYILKRCSVGLIPFRSGPSNDRVNPVKFYMYAFLGKPVVALENAELLRFPEFVHTCRTEAEFAEAIGKAAAESGTLAKTGKLRSFALSNTWEERARVAWDHLAAAELNNSPR